MSSTYRGVSNFTKSGNRGPVHTGTLWAFGSDERCRFQPPLPIKDFVLFALFLLPLSLHPAFLILSFK